MNVKAVKNEVRVKAKIGSEKYLIDLVAGKNSLIADEPEHLGGQNKGFNPYELLASALASCTAATLRMYTDKKEWNVGEIHVDVKLSNNTIDKQATFVKSIEFENKDLDEKTLARLKTIAESCPVNRLLQNNIEVISELK